MQIATETDIDILLQKAALLQRENDRLHSRLAEFAALLDKANGRDAQTLQQEIAWLTEQLNRDRERLYGRSSDRRPRDG